MGGIMEYTMLRSDSYFTKDEGANLIVISKVNGHSIFLNKVATWLFKQFNICTSSEELFEKMKKQYLDVNTDILKKDLMSFLYVMEVYQIITLSSETKCDEDIAYKISFVEESSYKKICSFMSDSKCWLNKPMLEVPFTPLILHKKNFANEEIFLQYVKDNELKVVVSFKMPIPESDVLVINRIYSRNIDGDELIIAIRQMLRRFLAKVTDIPRKTRIVVYKDDINDYTNVVELLHKCGFNKECELKNEIGDIDVEYYCVYN